MNKPMKLKVWDEPRECFVTNAANKQELTDFLDTLKPSKEVRIVLLTDRSHYDRIISDYSVLHKDDQKYSRALANVKSGKATLAVDSGAGTFGVFLVATDSLERRAKLSEPKTQP